MSWSSMPFELDALIASFLPYPDVRNMAQVNHRLNNNLRPHRPRLRNHYLKFRTDWEVFTLRLSHPFLKISALAELDRRHDAAEAITDEGTKVSRQTVILLLKSHWNDKDSNRAKFNQITLAIANRPNTL